MHELGTVNYVIKEVEKLVDEHNLSVVASITLQIGEVSGIIPEYIVDFWQWARKSTEHLQETELVVEKLEAITYCEDCGKTYPTMEYAKICPYCKSEHTYLVQGNEYIIKEIEAM
ncbi:MAG: hydrogenase maturation nickel metallochaperone HypA [Oscillospiraceae bacterium]|nr:hydrogenase maturation nickel metallochaperone HypA [Oscillospiraceae bacterium]